MGGLGGVGLCYLKELFRGFGFRGFGLGVERQELSVSRSRAVRVRDCPSNMFGW